MSWIKPNPAERWLRVLRWLSQAEPLVCPRVNDQYWPSADGLARFWPDAETRLQHLCRNLQPLLEWMARNRDWRMGMVFERLLSFWLRQQPHLRVLAENLPLRQQGRTLGAVDFLLLDERDGRLWHWEVACKFYLQRPLPAGGWQWLGPDGRDELGRKLGHMQDRQLPLSDHPAMHQWLEKQGHHGPVHRLGVIWGRLFHHEKRLSGNEYAPLNAHHPRGLWAQQMPPEPWQLCDKLDLLDTKGRFRAAPIDREQAQPIRFFRYTPDMA